MSPNQAVSMPLLLGFLFATPTPTFAIGQGRSQGEPNSPTEDVSQVAAQLGRECEERVLVEPGIQLTGKLRPVRDPNSVEAALNVLSKQLRDGAWARLDLRTAPGKHFPSALQLANLLRAARNVDSGRVIEAVADNRSLSLQPGKAVGSDQRPKSPTYLLYRTRLPAGYRAEEEFSDLQEENLRLMERLSSDATPNPMRAWMEGLRGLGEERMMQIVGPMAEAGMRLWDATPPEQRGDMIRDSMTVAKSYGGGLMAEPPVPNGKAGLEAIPRNHYPELASIAATLSAERKVRVLVEPSIFVSSRPKEPSADLTLEESLDAVLAKNKDITWRRIHIARSSATGADPARLAAEVRLWESAGLETLSVETGTAKSFTLRSGTVPAPVTEKEFETVYLILGVTDHHGMPTRERLTDLHRRQMDQLIRMSPDEVSNTMAEAIQSYQSAGTDNSRERIMALPAMAGMMEIWFPRAAKEGTLKP